MEQRIPIESICLIDSISIIYASEIQALFGVDGKKLGVHSLCKDVAIYISSEYACAPPIKLSPTFV